MFIVESTEIWMCVEEKTQSKLKKLGSSSKVEELRR